MDDYDPVETDTCFSYQDTCPGLSPISLRFSVYSLGQSLDVSAAPHSSYVACCGTSIQPVLQMLEQAPQLDTVLLCLDNDEAGHQASRRMREQLEVRYSVERLTPANKDWNDDLTLSAENAQGFSMNEMR
jgi:hypothetical protein